MIIRLTSFILAASTASLVVLGAAAESVPDDRKVDLDRANALLAQGQYTDAIALYDDVIQKDKSNYLSYYKRALSYLGLSRFHAAISDLDSVLAIQPDFSAALVQRGKLYAWQGEFQKAVTDLKKAHGQDEFIHDILEAERHSKESHTAETQGDYQKCIEEAGSALGIGTGVASLWQLRARCAIALGDSEGAVGDLTQASKLASSADINLQLSDLLFYSLNDYNSAINAVKKCLHQDPDNKQCKATFRMLKNASKSMTQLDNFIQGEKWHQAINILFNEGYLDQIKTQIKKLKSENLLTQNSQNWLLAQLEEWSCRSYSNLKKHNLAIVHCNTAIDLNPSSIPSLLSKAQSLLATESYDEAIQILNKANEVTGGQDQNVRHQLDRAQRLLRQSKKRDYYKILGISRDADSKSVRKAYRDMSKKYHPDKYRGNLDDDSVSRKMAEINSAYEVLGNEELRTRYDNGDDPNDHEGQQGYPGGNPFMFQQGGQNFFFQGGGQGGNVKFHFGF